jgi:methylmalonyl-CoA mutase N-terminal domain/subunit
LRTFSGSCGSTLVSQQPLNNVVRITLHALMGALGGHQAIHTACWDEGYAIPSEEAATLALRTQQILAHESGIANTIDPLAGSYYVEYLTNEIEARAAVKLEEIDAMGGMLRAIESGYIDREIRESSIRYQKAIDSGEMVVVGLNRYQAPEPDDAQLELFQSDPTVEPSQKERVGALRAKRDPGEVGSSLAALDAAIAGDQNVMPTVLRAVKAYATVGEISQVMRRRWGEYRGPVQV